MTSRDPNSNDSSNRSEGKPPEEAPATSRAKDPAAVALGRRGGLKGGRARAESLSAQQRTEIAREAARARWAAREG